MRLVRAYRPQVLIRVLIAATAMAAALPSVARAQIYTWRDPAGNLVLSDRPQHGAAVTYAVASTNGIRTTRAATARTTQYDSLISEHAAVHGVSLSNAIKGVTP